jgi:hypothetical protein
MFSEGLGVAPNESEARRQWTKAANRGISQAQFNIGLFNEGGRGGLPQSFEEAARMYDLAASQGHVGALANLGALYEDGRGVKQDAARAARLYRVAADRGSAQAAFNLGSLYRDGRGVPAEDGDEARKWFQRAKDLGLPGGVRRRLAWRWLRSQRLLWACLAAMAFQHFLIYDLLGARWSAMLVGGPLCVGACLGGIALRDRKNS